MEKHRAIPQGYMTVGEVAKKMNTTVRTLQYYDREGILKPSAESEGGRRLYTDRDIIKLHQILAMKYLGFSLDDIKGRLTSLETPEEVAAVLSEQAAGIREKIESLKDVLDALEKMEAEILQIKQVNFKKYADIIISLQRKSEYYYLIKHFDEPTMDFIRKRFGNNPERGFGLAKTAIGLLDEAERLMEEGVSPESEKGAELAKKFLNFIMEFTDGDMSLLPQMAHMSEAISDSEFKEKQQRALKFLDPALNAYITKLGHNPLEEGVN